MHQPHPVSPLGLIHVGGGREDSQAAAYETVQDFPELPAGDRVHPKGGLIQEQDPGRMNQGADQAQLLAHAPERFRASRSVKGVRLEKPSISGIRRSRSARSTR